MEANKMRRGPCYERECEAIKKKKSYSYTGEYCCDAMADAIGECRIHLDYDPQKNEYFVPLLYPETDVLILSYCPWCAEKLA